MEGKKYMKINLHLHSQCSDGSLAVKALANKMKQCRYSMISLTDHDTVDGIQDMTESCRRLEISFVPGIEMTSFVPRELNIYDDTYKVHILGLNIDSSKMQMYLNTHNANRDEYHLNLLKHYGVDIAAIIEKKEIGNRVFCAELLVNHGYFSSIEEALAQFHTSEYLPSVDEVIKEIHDSGGLAIWAHPFLLPRNGGYKIDSKTVEVIAKLFVKFGLDGMEGYYLQFTEEEQSFIASLCKQWNLYCSTGTDYHADYEWEEELLGVNGKTDSKLIDYLKNINERRIV